MTKKSFIVLVCVCLIMIAIKAQQSRDTHHPLVLTTAQAHSPIKSIEQLNQVIKNIPNLKAISLNVEAIQKVSGELRKITQEIGINRQRISSLQVREEDLKNINGVVFEQTQSIEDVKKALQSSEKNVLLYLTWTQRQRRDLTHHENMIHASVATVTRSEMFNNMSAVTLTGLLVSLFLIVILLIAIKCLYQIKTNDQFSRANLWVGKES